MKLLKFTKRPYLDKDIKQIIIYFLIWRVGLILISVAAPYFIPLRGRDFLGGGIESYNRAPWFFGWANFDGEHYLSIVSIGYKGLEQAFFPFFPLLIKMFSSPFGNSKEVLIITGLLVSNISFLLVLILLWKLILLDYSKDVAYLCLLVMLVFPTSFYFGSLYNESFYLLLTVGSFYLMRRNLWFLGSLAGIIASATRIFAILLTPAFLIEAWQQKIKLSRFFWAFFIPSGLIAYMCYQWVDFNDPLAFYHLQKIVGPQHESGITPLPQVYFRYINILLTAQVTNPIYQTVILEVFVGILFFLLPIYGLIKKMRHSYVFYALAGFLLPTIQGSFSSVPRYVLVFFPGFIALALLLNSLKKEFRIIILLLLGIWLVFETMLFIRGYWVA